MNLLQDILTYIRRIIKSPSNAVITDDLLIDYVNRFWIMDVDARMQLFDLKTKYSFQTQPGVDRYNMPLYNVQTEPGSQTIGSYPVYQGFLGPAYINGIPVSFQTEKNSFFNNWFKVVQWSQAVAVGDGTTGPYTITIPVSPNNSTPINPPIQSLLRGHVDIVGIIASSNDSGVNQDPIIGTTLSNLAGVVNIPITSIDPGIYFTSTDSTGANIIVSDSGQFLTGNVNYGLLMNQVPVAGGLAPFGYSALTGGYSTTSNTINYFTGTATITFPTAIPQGVNINAQCYFYQAGLPRGILYYNNTLTLRSPPDSQYLVELDAYLTPAAFLKTASTIPYGYMAEYIARGAARKILSDTGDVEQFAFYEPLFKEQELLVWKRSQRQWTSTRTQTIYSQGNNQNSLGFNNVSNTTY